MYKMKYKILLLQQINKTNFNNKKKGIIFHC